VIILTVFVVASENLNIFDKGYFDEEINENYLNELKEQAKVECLQNSQCSEGFDCVDNSCIDRTKIDLCKKVSLSTNARPLIIGNPINSAKRILTKTDLRDLLTDGEIIEINERREVVKHPYTSYIEVGDALVKEGIENYVVGGEDELLFSYKLVFSKSIDFSKSQIHGQVLRIFGKEYLIGSDSTNSVIILISENKTVELSDKNIVIERDSGGFIYSFEKKFEGSLGVGEKHSDTFFEEVELSFNSLDINGLADVTFGGIC